MGLSANSELGRCALAFVDTAATMHSSQAVAALFQATIYEFGYHSYIMAGIPEPGISFNRVTLANGWPDEWFQIYAYENFVTVDPVPRHAQTTVDPFEWCEAVCDPVHDKAAHAVMERAIDFGLNQGFCIPIHYESSTAAVSIAGDQPDITSASKNALHLIGLYAHGRIRSLARPKKPNRTLSNNEAEVLRWAAIGKTAWETSVILSTSERNVRYYLSEAQRKLAAPNRTATVVNALIKGEIKL